MSIYFILWYVLHFNSIISNYICEFGAIYAALFFYREIEQLITRRSVNILE